jgi:hypothetical protein
MNTIRIRRAGIVAAGTTAALALGMGTASAHHCYVPMYSLNGPTSSNWLVFSAEDGAAMGEYTAACDGAADAGYDALREAGMPVGIKIFDKMTIGDPKGEFRIPNPNGADGKGLEYFGAGSTLADDMVATWIAGAESYTC